MNLKDLVGKNLEVIDVAYTSILFQDLTNGDFGRLDNLILLEYVSDSGQDVVGVTVSQLKKK